MVENILVESDSFFLKRNKFFFLVKIVDIRDIIDIPTQLFLWLHPQQLLFLTVLY